MSEKVYTKVELSNLCGGAVPELFQRELDNVLANVVDPNTSATAARKITLEVTFKPKEDREYGEVTIKAKSALAAVKEVVQPIFFGKDGRRDAAFQSNPKVDGIFDVAAPGIKAVK